MGAGSPVANNLFSRQMLFVLLGVNVEAGGVCMVGSSGGHGSGS